MPDSFETDTLLSPAESTGSTQEQVAPPDALAKASPNVDATLPESPEAYSLGLEDLISSDQSLAGLQIDSALEADFRKTAHSLGMSQNAATELARMYARHQARQTEEGRTRQAKALQDMEAGWISELKADKDLPAQLTRARAAIKSYGSPELACVLEETRLGSHPAFVRFMARVGQALAEPAFAHGHAASEEKSPAEVLYPNQNQL